MRNNKMNLARYDVHQCQCLLHIGCKLFILTLPTIKLYSLKLYIYIYIYIYMHATSLHALSSTSTIIKKLEETTSTFDFGTRNKLQSFRNL